MSVADTYRPAAGTVTESRFRDVIGRFASGVTVITTNVDGVDHGTTASAMCSVSADPPMLLVCLNKASNTGRAVEQAGRFVVNILSAAQADLAKRFAVKSPDKFAGIHLGRTDDGLPYLEDTLARLGCVVVNQVPAGSHQVHIADVVTAEAVDNDRPLTYYRGTFGGFQRQVAMSSSPGLMSFVQNLNVDLW